MKKYLFIILSLLIVFISFWYVKSLKETTKNNELDNIGSFNRQHVCGKQPNFLKKLHIISPIAIDLSQQRYKGLAFLHGRGLSKSLHLKTWEQFDHFSSYVLTPNGDMFLTPMPYISIKEHTFEFQSNIYRLDSNSGKVEIWLQLEDVHAGLNNPYGVISLAYDCEDHTLWVSALDETNYDDNRGVIYHIDIQSKKVLQRVDGVDALSLKLIKSEKGKFLLAGMTRENSLVAYAIVKQKLILKELKLFNFGRSNERIRKISIVHKNQLQLKTIPFSYSLVAQTGLESIRKTYLINWNKSSQLFYMNIQ